MIVDAFTFYNELEMLQFRLELLDRYVDKFIIVEADHTFSGQPKKSIFLENRDLFKRYEHKIIHSIAKIDTGALSLDKRPDVYSPTDDFWSIEYTQRNHIGKVLRDQQIPGSAIVLLADVDEIPDLSLMRAIAWNPFRRKKIRKNAWVLRMETYYYNAQKLRTEICQATILASCRRMMDETPQALRNGRSVHPVIENGGWHFSYFMSPDMIATKIASFSHQELNSDKYKDLSRISERIKSGEDLFDRDIGVTQVSPTKFPHRLRQLLKKHQWL